MSAEEITLLFYYLDRIDKLLQMIVVFIDIGIFITIYKMCKGFWNMFFK